VSRTPFDPPAFNPAKLTVAYELGCTPLAPPPLDARRYTLTHNDLTGALQLSIGRHFNLPQLSGELKLTGCESAQQGANACSPLLQLMRTQMISPPSIRPTECCCWAACW
jgi:Staygreen protein